MPKPIVAIVGRQNVGKSTLFNRITGRRTAIVRDEPGVTRDRNYEEIEWEGRTFILLDTGGFLSHEESELLAQVTDHAILGIEEADLVIHLLDARAGLTPADRELAEVIRRRNKKILWVANKIDTPGNEPLLHDFHALGDRVLPLSSEHGYGFDDLMDEIIANIRPYEEEERDKAQMPKVAVVGRPNVGKSTLVNTLLGTERMIVSPVSGTTRDAVDSVCKYYGRPYLFIDTAGIRRKGRITRDVEHYSVVRAIRAIERADTAVLILDATEGLVEQDKKIADIIDRAGKGMVIVINKWDLVEDHEHTFEEFIATIEEELWSASYAPVLTASGLTKKRITKIFPLVDEIMEERKRKIATGPLNRLSAAFSQALPAYKGKQTRIFYMTQTGIEPPRFTLFVNYPDAIKEGNIRYLEKMIRDTYSFKGTPIRIQIRKK